MFLYSSSAATTAKAADRVKMHHKNNDLMHSITMDQSPDVTMESDQNNNNENSSNNNLQSIKKNEKYSLRQRGQRKSITNKQLKGGAVASSGRGNSRSQTKLNDAANDEFTALMSGNGVTTTTTTTTTTSSTKSTTQKLPKEKPKQRAAPLSKYRRKTANARERTRMREINHAFENLRQSVPVVVAGEAAQSTNEKLTKITTLRMAMKYIKILSDILDHKTEVSEELLASLMEVDNNSSSMSSSSSISSYSSSSSYTSKESFKEIKEVKKNKPATVTSKHSKEKATSKAAINILAQNHHDYCKEIIREAIVKPVKLSKVTPKKSVKTSNARTKKQPAKGHSKALQKASVKQEPLAPPINRNPSQVHQENKFINHLLGGNFNQTMLHGSSINNNSLNYLSKYDLSPCLTPPNDDSPADLGLILESDGESLQLSEPCFSPLELGLLLESDGESLHLSEPCLSPLNHLDALNSFNDLLHSGFSEHNSLEMYLS